MIDMPKMNKKNRSAVEERKQVIKFHHLLPYESFDLNIYNAVQSGSVSCGHARMYILISLIQSQYQHIFSENNEWVIWHFSFFFLHLTVGQKLIYLV